MFIGHIAVAFAGKKVAPRTSFAVLFAASVLLDVVWQFFVLLDWEHVRFDPGNTRFTPLNFVYYPWSHSLLFTFAWATIFGFSYFLASRCRRGFVVVWLCVASHWVLDFIAHRPDLPLYPGGPLVGLGLWNSPAATIAVEVGMLAGGAALYASATRPADKIGKYGFPIFIAVVLAAYFADRFAALPSSTSQIVAPGIVFELIMLVCAAWFDNHRRPT